MQNLNRISKTFAVQIVTFIFLFSLLIFSLMLLVNALMTRKVMISNAELIAKTLASENILHINGILSNLEKQTSGAAYLINSNMLSNQEQFAYFKEQLHNNDEMHSICVAYTPEYLERNKNASSKVYSIVDTLFIEKNINTNAKEYQLDDWFIIPRTQKIPYWSEPWIDTHIDAHQITSYSVPMYENGVFIGVARTDMSLKVLQRIVSSVRLLKTGYAILLSKNGTFITHPADSLILNYTIFSYAEQLKVQKLREVGREMVSGKSGFAQLPFSTQYKSRWIYYAPITRNHWSIGVKFSDNEIMGDLKRVILTFSLILCIGFLILLASIYTRISAIFNPLRLLIRATNKIGSGDFNVELPVIKMNNEVSLLTSAFQKMQTELKTYMQNLIKTNREKEKIAAEIRFAAQIQQNIIPSNQNLLTDIPEVSIFGILEPAEEIGGDLYDAFMIDNKRMCFAIADVFGKGIVASMLMTMVQTLIRSKTKYTSSVITLMQEINAYLCENNKQSNFITLIIGIMDLSTGVVEFCNSGHTPLYLRKASQQCIRYGETHSTALGIFPDLNMTSSFIQLDLQDSIILFTDGITEAMSTNEAFFGYSRLESIICDLQNPNPETIVQSILQGVRNFTGQDSQNDDLSILVIKFNHPRP
jgi:sigma-B regulation protein RsbU (phosphoserine phosphatase)